MHVVHLEDDMFGMLVPCSFSVMQSNFQKKKKSHAVMRSSLYGLSESVWKRGILHGVIRVPSSFSGFRSFSPQLSNACSSKANLQPRMAEESEAFYVVRKGDIIGIYKSLSDCQAQVSSSVCDPSISVYKGYSLSNDSKEYLASHGFRDALYSLNALHLKDGMFGKLMPRPFQQPDELAFVAKKTPKKGSRRKIKGSSDSDYTSVSLPVGLPDTSSAAESQLISCKPMTCILEFDGASKGNPGKAGAAAILRNADGSVVSCVREGLGTSTNNVAEYRALILGLKCALRKGCKHIQVQGDSQLVCMQVQGLWQTKSHNLAALCEEVKSLKDMFQSFHIIQVKRGFNAVADNLANTAVTLPVGEVCEDSGPFS